MNHILLVAGLVLVLSALPGLAQQQPSPGESGSMKKVDPPTNPSPRAPANQGATTGTTMGPAGTDQGEKSGSYSRPPDAPDQPQRPMPRQ